MPMLRQALQEPGRYFLSIGLEAPGPQRKVPTVALPTEAAARGEFPAVAGTRRIVVARTSVGSDTSDDSATVMTPLVSVTTVFTYFDCPPAVASQPQVLAPGAVVAVW